MKTEIKRPPLRYFGGKWMLAPWIISHFPTHRTYTEAFAGGASVLMRKQRSYAEIYNDLSGHIVNVFRVLRDPEQSAELERQLKITPFSRTEYDQTFDLDPTDPIEWARRTIVRSHMGFGADAITKISRNKTGFRSTSSRSGTSPAHDWSNYLSMIGSFSRRLEAVVIESVDAAAVLERHDRPDTLHYIDPPYVHATRGMKGGYHSYEHDMTDEQHRKLAAVIKNLSGMVIISGYNCDLYEELFDGWERRDKAHHADGAQDRTESIWMNAGASDRTPQPKLL